jgi:hypothetical protein
MGLTLIAILTAALLLPGILAAWAFFRAAQTNEVESSVPALSTPEGIALVGGFSVAVHFLYILILKAIVSLPPRIPLPLADPYVLFSPDPHLTTSDAAYALFSGLVGLGILALVLGRVAGWLLMRREDKSIFYGPLSDLLESGHGDDSFISAYVISKIGDEKRVFGYQGTVVSLSRDADRYPSKVVLRDVVPFYLHMAPGGPRRQETNQLIDWLVLTAADWHNIAFRVYRYVED